MKNGLSAYLSIYNDWDMLEHVLRSIAQVVDDLVVVDGAYEWLAPYYQALGSISERSDDRLYAILENSSIPFRLVSGLWKSETEKRTAGYESCRQRYAFRVDADEIVFFDEIRLARFFNGGAVAQVEIPTYVAPGWVLARTQTNTTVPGRAILPRAGFLFDRNQVSAPLHLNYLWLSSAPRERSRPFAVESEAIGFVAHLTQWRSADAAARRAAFYALKWARQHGLSWIPQLRDRALPDLQALFEFVSPLALHEVFLASKVTPTAVAPSQCVRRSPLADSDEQRFAACHADRLASVAALADRMAQEGLQFAPRLPLSIDLTGGSDVFGEAGVMRIEFEEQIASVRAQIYTVHSTPPWGRWTRLAPRVGGRVVELTLSSDARSELGDCLRGLLELRVELQSDRPIQKFRLCQDRSVPARTTEAHTSSR